MVMNQKRRRIDRALCSVERMEIMKDLKLWCRGRVLSYRCHIVVKEGNTFQWRPKSFRINDNWSCQNGFMELCEKTWKELQVEGWAVFRLVRKLRTMNGVIKLWKKRGVWFCG